MLLFTFKWKILSWDHLNKLLRPFSTISTHSCEPISTQFWPQKKHTWLSFSLLIENFISTLTKTSVSSLIGPICGSEIATKMTRTTTISTTTSTTKDDFSQIRHVSATFTKIYYLHDKLRKSLKLGKLYIMQKWRFQLAISYSQDVKTCFLDFDI